LSIKETGYTENRLIEIPGSDKDDDDDNNNNNNNNNNVPIGRIDVWLRKILRNKL
jgi:hypothetical protein